MSPKRLGTGDGIYRFRRQNRRRCLGVASEKNPLHMPRMQTKRKQDPVHFSLPTRRNQLRLEAALKTL